MTASTGKITVREATIDLLRRLEMTTVFGNPGSTELPFLNNWPRDFRYILGLQEASVVAMADGYARATGRAAFCNLHSAVGIGHALGSVFTAFRNQVPLVISAGQQARSLLPMQPFLGATEAANDTYALSNGTARAVLGQGKKNWFFLTVDYAFGRSLEQEATSLIEASGGKVLGRARFPLGTNDFSSFLLQAQASKADVVAFASAGADTVNALKQAAEFGLPQGGQQLAGLLVLLPDIEALGVKAAQGLVVTESFYWDIDDKTRAWTKRFQSAFKGKFPTMTQAGAYSATLHYLKAVQAAGTTDSDKVAAKMRELPVNDFYNENVAIRPDGRVLVKMYLAQVKTPAESKSPQDAYKILGTIAGKDAFRPLAESQCPLVRDARK